MKCTKCNIDVSDEEKFCPNCGNLMNGEYSSNNVVTEYNDTFSKYLFGALLFFEIVLGYILPLKYLNQYFNGNLEFYVRHLGELENIWIDNSFIYGGIGGFYSAIVFIFTALSKYSKDKKFRLFYFLAPIAGIICVFLIFIVLLALCTSMLMGCE